MPRYFENGDELNSDNILFYKDELFEYFEKNVYNQDSRYGDKLIIRYFDELYRNKLNSYNSSNLVEDIFNRRKEPLNVIKTYLDSEIDNGISKLAYVIKNDEKINVVSKWLTFEQWLNDNYSRSKQDITIDNLLTIDRRKESKYSFDSLITELALSLSGFDLPYDIADISEALELGDKKDVAINTAFILPIVGVAKSVKKLKNVDKLEYVDEIFESTDDLLKHFDEAGKAVEEIVDDGSHTVTRVNNRGREVITGLKPNTTYKVGEFGNHIYKTDNLGRIVEVQVDNLQISTKARLPHNQDTPGKLDGDHAGHLIADLFGGSKEIDNLVSMLSELNQGAYRKMEREWAKVLKSGGSVTDIRIKVSYDGDGLRPTLFDVNYNLDGTPISNKFSNLE